MVIITLWLTMMGKEKPLMLTVQRYNNLGVNCYLACSNLASVKLSQLQTPHILKIGEVLQH